MVDNLSSDMRRSRIQEILEDAEAAPWRARLMKILAGVPDDVQFVIPPESAFECDWAMKAWDRTNDGPDLVRGLFLTAADVVDFLAGFFREREGEWVVIPGPEPSIGCLLLRAAPSSALLAALVDWEGDGVLFASHQWPLVLSDRLDEGFEVQVSGSAGSKPRGRVQRTGPA